MPRTGIKSFGVQSLYTNLNLKNDLLFFDKILIDQAGYNMAKGMGEKLLTFFENSNPGLKENMLFNLNEIDYLESIGLLEVKEMNIGIPSDKHKNDMLLMKEVFKELFGEIKITTNTSGEKLIDFTQRLKNYDFVSDFKIRHYNIQQIEKNNAELYPILINANSFQVENIANKNSVIQFVLKKLPAPSELNSWDEIIEFRKDIDSQAKYFNLINWINQVSNENLALSEFEDKFNHLYFDYLNQLKVSNKKHNLSMLELIINGSANLIENILKLNFSKLSKSLFSISKTSINVLEAELSIKNRELAYIHKVESTFNSNGR